MDEIDGLPVIVMELLNGRPLSELMDRPWDAEAQIDLMRQSAGGLAAAHAAGVVHGDLKPANIIFADDRPVIVDFGLSFPDGAFMLQGNQADDDQNLPTQNSPGVTERTPDLNALGERSIAITATADSDARSDLEATDSWTLGHPPAGQDHPVAGTFAYMAPEMLFENRKDQQSDIFSLGLIFLEVITGQRDRLGKSIGEIAANLKRTDLAEFLCSDVGVPISPTIRRMLSRRPEERPVAADIESALSVRSTSS